MILISFEELIKNINYYKIIKKVEKVLFNYKK